MKAKNIEQSIWNNMNRDNALVTEIDRLVAELSASVEREAELRLALTELVTVAVVPNGEKQNRAFSAFAKAKEILG